jgi:hypothetical protein
MKLPRSPQNLTAAEFNAALKEAGFGVEHARIIDVSGPVTPAARRASLQARTARANKRAADLAPTIAELQAAVITTLRAIAAALNARGIQTPRGTSRWYHTQGGRLLARLPA